MFNILDKVANELSLQRLVPFVGAGASFPQLKTDWDGICSKMNSKTGSIEKDNLRAAQKFIDKYGKKRFATFLKQNLIIQEFDDTLGENYLFLMALNCYHYYTTNQDNVFEKCFEKYHREFQIVSTLDTFKKMNPNQQTIFKFHGDLDYPESIVFSTNDYDRRMPISKDLSSYNPLDIMLIADMISKGIFFIGYLFRDPNIINIFEHIGKIFDYKPPKSYLLQYIPDNQFENDMLKYNMY
jgi:hypothetical protein